MPDPYLRSSGPTSPGVKHAAVTPNDSTDLPTVARSLYIGTGGDVRFVASSDTTPVTWVAVPTGAIIPMWVKRVYAAGTTASNIVAIY